MPSTQTSPTPDKDLSNITKAIIKTNLGNITVEFFNQDAPKTVANFVKLASAGFYDGTKFHRVIKDFMIQGGDPLTKDDSLKNSWGTGGPDYRFADEINSHKLVRGSLAMANSGPDTNGCQFFIVTAESTPWLDGKHTNFGQVVAGLDVVDKIENIKTQGPDRPISNVIIESVELK
ncbi:MAG: peptidylprolyl isomerase [Patescibacteria group bacterium]